MLHYFLSTPAVPAAPLTLWDVFLLKHWLKGTTRKRSQLSSVTLPLRFYLLTNHLQPPRQTASSTPAIYTTTSAAFKLSGHIPSSINKNSYKTYNYTSIMIISRKACGRVIGWGGPSRLFVSGPTFFCVLLYWSAHWSCLLYRPVCARAFFLGKL